MAEEFQQNQDQEPQVPQVAAEPEFAPGELTSYDYSPDQNAELSEVAQNGLEQLCREASKRDTAARRMEVEQSWQARLFYRGYQYLLPRRGGGWTLPGESSGYGPKDQLQASALYETNIYGTHCDILTSALVRDIPQCRFEPFNPNFAPDVTAADAAQDFAKIFARNNDLKKLHTQAANYMCTDGRVLFYTRYVLDGQRFGFEDPELDSPVVPEDMTTGAQPDIGQDQQEIQDFANSSPVAAKRKPRGREVTDVFGKLEHKVPINTRDMSQMHFIQLEWEEDVSITKARFSEIANKIKPGASGPGENKLDRIARVNSQLALQGSYVTGDSYNRDVTIQYTWFRPSAFFDEKIEDAVRQELLKAFPNGCLVVFAGQTFAFARPECMDDHLHILHAFPGNGQNRGALCSKLLSIQQRLNNWLDLLNDYFVRTVPQKWFDADVFNLEALRTQPNVPGGIHGFQRQPGVPTNELIFVEPTPTHQPAMPEFINFFFNEYPEMLSGALPSLFGAESNTETVGGMQIQRDQALGRLASPWGALQSSVAAYFRQAVMCAARCRQEQSLTEAVPGRGIINVEVGDLKGNVLCFPEQDSNFPETWVQRSSRLQQLFAEAPGNPFIGKLLASPKNMRIAKDGIGLTDLDIAEVAAVEKQEGEFQILLKTGPVPNPAITQAQEQMAEAAQQAASEGPEAMQQFEQMSQQAIQMIKGLPQQVSTVPVMQDDSEDHASEAFTCKAWLNSEEGRKFKHGTPEQQEAWENVHLHYLEHQKMAKQITAENAPAPEAKATFTANLKDMPPQEAADALSKVGIKASPEDFMQEHAAATESKIAVKKAQSTKPQGGGFVQ